MRLKNYQSAVQLMIWEEEKTLKKYQDNISLKIPVKLRYLPFVLDSTKAFAKIVGFDEKQANEILLGIEEAVANLGKSGKETCLIKYLGKSPEVKKPDFEKMGFFFSGIMPGSNGRDRLILQYLNNQRIDYEKIHINSDTGKKILEYIKKRDPSQAVQGKL